MESQIDKYTYRVTWSEEDQEFVGLCTEFSSLSWLSPSYKKALEGIRSLIKECIEDMIENNEKIPLPISIQNYSGEFMVKIPPEIHRHLAIEAAESNVSLNLIANAKLAQ